MTLLNAFTDRIYEFDFAILDWIAEHIHNGFLDVVMPAITFLGDGGWFWIACAVVMLFFKKTRKTGIMLGLALLCGLFVCNLGLKPLVARIRPYHMRPWIELIIDEPSEFSFPSGHTIASFEAAIVLMRRDRKHFGWAALALAVLIAFSRLYLYVHYPTDVIASVILGTLIACFAVWIVDFIHEKILARKQK